MKRILLMLLVVAFFVYPLPTIYADRETPTITGYTSNTLIKRGDWKIYRITFVATSDAGSFTVYDSLTVGAGSNANVKIEGSEEKTAGGKTLDFTGKPLEGSTGLFLVISNANVIVEYK